jgi:hypothetical protein
LVLNASSFVLCLNVAACTEKGHETGEELAELRGDSVILATGGYSRADDLLRKYIPKIVDLPTTNGTTKSCCGTLAASPFK